MYNVKTALSEWGTNPFYISVAQTQVMKFDWFQSKALRIIFHWLLLIIIIMKPIIQKTADLVTQ